MALNPPEPIDPIAISSRFSRGPPCISTDLQPEGLGLDSTSLSTEELCSLEGAWRAQPWRLVFTPRLEAAYWNAQRVANRTERLVLPSVALLLFLSAPLWTAFLGPVPEDLSTTIRDISWGVASPLILLILMIQYFERPRWLSDASLVAMAAIQIVITEYTRIESYRSGLVVNPVITATIPIGVLATLFLPFNKRVLIVLLYFLIISISELGFSMGAEQRTRFDWMTDIFLISLSFLGSNFVHLSTKRAWSANLLLDHHDRTDHLTGLQTRRAFTLDFKNMVARVTQDCPSSLAIIDVDHFKRLNDQYGHPYGDTVLQGVAILLKKHARRRGDRVSRIGGDEFAVLLENCGVEQAIERLHSLRDELLWAGVPSLGLKPGFATLSMGVTNVPADTEWKSSYYHADRALYQAKAKGRHSISAEVSQAEVSDSTLPTLFQ